MIGLNDATGIRSEISATCQCIRRGIRGCTGNTRISSPVTDSAQANGTISELAGVAARVGKFGNGLEDLFLEAFVFRQRTSGDSA